MMLHRRTLAVVVAMSVIGSLSLKNANAVTTYDLAADWSDTNNPNGVWSYNGVDGLPLPVHRADWDSQTRIEHFTSAQPAWSAEDLSRSVPMAFKSLGATAGTIWNLDAPVGSVGMHGQPDFAGITWTSPSDGIATVSGNVWKMRNNIGRTIEWRLTQNDSILTGGTLTEANPYTSANPFDLADGFGGVSALTIPVMAGDVIGLDAGNSVSQDSDFVGVNWSVSVVPNPAPRFYWTDPGSDVIRRANADGSGIQTVVSGLEEPRGMALDLVNQQVYWADPGAKAIRAANMDGSGPIQTVVSAGDGTAGVALDVPGGKMYWTDTDNFQINHGGLSGQIRRANLDGSDPDDLVTGLLHPAGIALDPVHGKVYWTELEITSDGMGSIQRANLDGSNIETILTGIDEANGLALDPIHGRLYWPDLTTHRIQTSNLDGSDLHDVLTGLDSPTNVALDIPAGKIYWTNSGGQQANQINRANLDGSDSETLISGVGAPWGIAIVPEPSSYVLLAIGLFGVWCKRYRCLG